MYNLFVRKQELRETGPISKKIHFYACNCIKFIMYHIHIIKIVSHNVLLRKFDYLKNYIL